MPCVLGNSYYLCIIFVLSSNYLFLFSRLGQVALYVGAPWQQQWTSSPSWESNKGKGVLSCLGCFGQCLYGVITIFTLFMFFFGILSLLRYLLEVVTFVAVIVVSMVCWSSAKMFINDDDSSVMKPVT